MLSIDIPRYFYMSQNHKLSQEEIDYQIRMKESVIYVKMTESLNAQKITELFNIYGDINVRSSRSLNINIQVVKTSNTSCYVEFSFIDKDLIKSQKITDLMKKAENDLKRKQKGLIQSIVGFENAERFVCKDQGFGIFY